MNRSRLKAFAVFAFCAEMARLPGHCAPRLEPEKDNHANHSVTVHNRAPHLIIQTTHLRLGRGYERGFQSGVIRQSRTGAFPLRNLGSRRYGPARMRARRRSKKLLARLGASILAYFLSFKSA